MDNSDIKHILKLSAAGLIGLLPIAYVVKERLGDKDDTFFFKMKGGSIEQTAGDQTAGDIIDPSTAEKLNYRENVFSQKENFPNKNDSNIDGKKNGKGKKKPSEPTPFHPQIKPLTHYSIASTFLHGAFSGAGVVITEIILVYYLSQYFPKPGTNHNENNKNNNNNNSENSNNSESSNPVLDGSIPLIVPVKF